MKKLAFLFFFLSFMVFLITSAGNTPYDYFTRLGDSFLHGRYWLTQNPPWLSELIPAGPEKFFVVYPPMPAIIAIPFVFLFGKNFPQNYIAHLLGAATVALTMLISWQIKKDRKLALWSGILVGFGSIIWFMSSVGSVWYLGQITAALFLTAALYESLTKKRPFIVGLALGAAYLSRIHTILSLPLFLYLLRTKGQNRKNIFLLILGTSPFILFNAAYNFIRFKVFWDIGYFLLPALLNETKAPWFIKGVMNPAYIPDHLKAAFWSFPKIIKNFPFIQPSWSALSIWITTPAFLFSLKAPLRQNSVKLAWLVVAVLFLFVSMHGGTGWAQFGYRFAVDFYPFLVFLTIKGVSQTKLTKLHWIILFAGIIVNLWGVLWINKFNWVSF